MKTLSVLSIFVLLLFVGGVKAFAGGALLVQTGTNFCEDGGSLTYDESFCEGFVGETVNINVSAGSGACSGLTIIGCVQRLGGNGNSTPRGTGKGGNKKAFTYTFATGDPATLRIELNSTLKCNSGYFKKYFTRSTVIQTLSWSVV